MYTYKKTLTALFLIYTLTNPLKAANIIDHGDDDQKEGFDSTQPNNQVEQPKQVCDYTILNNKKVNHILDDIDDIEDELEDRILNVNRKLTNNQSPLLLLGAVLQHNQTKKHYQYLITSTGLLSETTQLNAVTKAHKKGFHLIKATPGHVMLQLLAWLQVSQHYTLTALYTNRPVCRNCYLIANSLWKKKLQTNEKGCIEAQYSVLDKIPNLAQQYINTHLNLSLVQSLVVPMMGYVSKEEMNKAIEEKDEKINMLNKEINKKDNQLKDKMEKIIGLQAQVQQNQNALKNKNQRIKNLNNQPNNKQKLNNKKQKNKKNQQIKANDNKMTTSQAHQEVNKYRSYLSKDIAAKINTLEIKFEITLDNIHIQNKNSVESFAQKAKIQIKKGEKQLDKDMQTLRKWYQKYKGDDLKYFYHNDKNHDYSKYGITYASTLTDIKEKIRSVLEQIDKEEIFLSILRSLKTVLSTNQAHSWGVNEALNQNNLKIQDYLSKVCDLDDKLERGIETISEGAYWKWNLLEMDE